MRCRVQITRNKAERESRGHVSLCNGVGIKPKPRPPCQILHLGASADLHNHRETDSQAKLLLPDGVQVPVDGLRPLLGFADLDGDVRVAGARPVLGLETLCADD